MNLVARRIAIRGRVQAVGFRASAAYAALDCAVTGWVRNRSDGSVEAFAQGTPEAVDRFVAWCRHGSPPARVDAVTIVEVSIEPALKEFGQRPSL